MEEKIGQLFIIRPEALDFNNSYENHYTDLNEEMIENFYKYPCGGFVLFAKNIQIEEQLINLNNKLHKLHLISPFVSIDEEGGSVSRIANNPNFDIVEDFPNMNYILKLGDPAYAYNVGYQIGKYLKKYDIDLNFAPVADVNTNALNTVIGDRAFGSDPFAASWMVQSYVFGLHDTGIYSCVKHFPGHGDTYNDSHYKPAYTYKTWEEMLDCEMYTFRGAFEANTEFTMIGHISAPNVTGDDEPATLSYELVTNKLRNELGYDGIIITDSMEMGAIAKNYSVEESTVKAIKAGVDIILMPTNYRRAFDAVKDAVINGEISEERINESVYRIIKLKYSKFTNIERFNKYFDDKYRYKQQLNTPIFKNVLG
ncbi:MAG: glycoside hydrolase family 3 protein [Erysipelotrichaceae bacterium]|nr:glycoside hydrolase family 3 protein [Erysipelotrichaceae bacterium]